MVTLDTHSVLQVSAPPRNIDLTPFYLPLPFPHKKILKSFRPLLYQHFMSNFGGLGSLNVHASKKQRQNKKTYFQQWNKNKLEQWNINMQVHKLKYKGQLGIF